MRVQITQQGFDLGRQLAGHLVGLGYAFDQVADLHRRYDRARLRADLQAFLLGRLSPGASLKLLAVHLARQHG